MEKSPEHLQVTDSKSIHDSVQDPTQTFSPQNPKLQSSPKKYDYLSEPKPLKYEQIYSLRYQIS